MENNTNNTQKSLTELMAEGLSDKPALSRRERRMLAEAADTKKPAAASKISEDLNKLEEAEEDKTPTQEYTPVRAQKDEKKEVKKPVILDDDDDDEDDDDEDEVVPAKKPEKKQKNQKKRPVIDEDDDDEDDDYDEDDDDDYEDDDDEEEVTFGKRFLGFLKGLIALIILLLLVVLALQIAEKSGRVDLDWVREKVGGTVPFIHTIFPDPTPDNMPV